MNGMQWDVDGGGMDERRKGGREGSVLWFEVRLLSNRFRNTVWWCSGAGLRCACGVLSERSIPRREVLLMSECVDTA